MHIDGNTVETETDADGSDINEYPYDDKQSEKPTNGMFGCS